ncbi:MAG TPA: hypothetical protein VE223_07400 [Nitrososphaeraceae archaeon]|nr:hypothetical protein [Nitrososphaeraceae archaeon]
MQIKNKNMITIAIIVLGATLGIALIATYNPIGQAKVETNNNLTAADSYRTS